MDLEHDSVVVSCDVGQAHRWDDLSAKLARVTEILRAGVISFSDVILFDCKRHAAASKATVRSSAPASRHQAGRLRVLLQSFWRSFHWLRVRFMHCNWLSLYTEKKGLYNLGNNGKLCDCTVDWKGVVRFIRISRGKQFAYYSDEIIRRTRRKS